MANTEKTDSLEALRRIEEAKATGAEELDLRDLNIPDGPPEALVRLHCLKSFAPSRTIQDLESLAKLSGLQSLSLSYCKQVTDLGPLEQLSGLQSLDLSGCKQVTDLGSLAKLSGLQSLSLSDCEQVTDLGPLEMLSGLQSLSLSYCKQVTDLGPLEQLELGFSRSTSLVANKVTDLGSLAKLSGLQSLSLSDCEQVTDLGPLEMLSGLQSLNLWGCKQVTDLGPLAKLSGLKSLSLSYCEQVTDLGPLEQLSGLQSLDLSGCKQVTDLGPLAKLSGLQSLSLWGCKQVTDLGSLAKLSGLQSLDLRGCNQVTDLGPLAKLSGLQSLDLWGCKQVTDLGPLAKLSGLKSLNLSYCEQVTDLGPLEQLSGLQSLDLSGCKQVTDLGPLEMLSGLQSLDLRSCNQVTDLGPLAKLSGLQSLDLSSCKQVTDLGPLEMLASLKVLTIWGHSNLICFAPVVPMLPQLTELRLFGSVFRDLPVEVCGEEHHQNVLGQVRAHYEDLKSGSTTDYETRVIVLGNGRAGKTQLCRRLRGDNFDEGEPSTHGIQVYETRISLDENGDPIPLHLWDFGGQEIYHGSHALFAQGRAVFLLVWTPTLEGPKQYSDHGISMRHRPLSYWVDYLKAFAGTENPLILVQSQCDTASQRAVKPPVADLDGFFSRQIVETSAKTGLGFPKLLGALTEAVRDGLEKRPAVPMGSGRFRVRKRLRKLLQDNPERYRFLERAEFDRICEEEGGISDPAALLQFLHQGGAIFYRRDVFGERIILDQNWMLRAVYTVFDRELVLPLLRGYGHFNRVELERLVWGEYSREEQTVFLEFMVSCGICFSIGDRSGGEAEYLAPELLPPWNEAQRMLLAGRVPGDTPVAQVEVRYLFLHEGILRNFLSRIGRQAGESAIYWKYGCWFYEATTDSRALIESRWDNDEDESGPGVISMRAWGKMADELLNPLLKELEEIPMAQKPEIARSQAAPQRAKGDDKKAGLDDLEIREQPRPGHGRPKAFLSYAWGDDSNEGRQRATIADGICAHIEQAGWEVVRDIKDMHDGDLISKFMKTLSQGDLIVVVVSEKYLQSIPCMTELFGIFQQARQDGEEFQRRIIPQVLSGAIDKWKDRATLAQHWKAESKAMDRVRFDLGDIDSMLHRQMLKWHTSVGDITAFISDLVGPRGYEAIVKDDYRALREMLARKGVELGISSTGLQS